MLKGITDNTINLEEAKQQAYEYLSEELATYVIEDDEITEIEYPVLEYPKSVKSLGFDKLPIGAIVGEAELVDVKKYETPEQHKKDKEKHLADSSWGKYGFVLKNVKRIEPIPAKGMLGFWEIGSFL